MRKKDVKDKERLDLRGLPVDSRYFIAHPPRNTVSWTSARTLREAHKARTEQIAEEYVFFRLTHVCQEQFTDDSFFKTIAAKNFGSQMYPTFNYNCMGSRSNVGFWDTYKYQWYYQ